MRTIRQLPCPSRNRAPWAQSLALTLALALCACTAEITGAGTPGASGTVPGGAPASGGRAIVSRFEGHGRGGCAMYFSACRPPLRAGLLGHES